MNPHSQTVLDQVLSLPVEERIKIADQLLLSLNSAGQAEIDQAWAVEAERRVKQIENSEVETVSWDECEAKVKALLNQ